MVSATLSLGGQIVDSLDETIQLGDFALSMWDIYHKVDF